MTSGRWKATPRGRTLLSASWLGAGVPFWGLPQQRGTPTPSLPFGLPEGTQGWMSQAVRVWAARSCRGLPHPAVGRTWAAGSLATSPLLPVLVATFLPSLEGQSCWAAIYSGLRLFTERASKRASSWQGMR